ncbi:MAG TPA: class I SAM-dependent methyltransferase [Candidatus Nanoarchaeia archaeon]|nr:class I SAM-dependent methyltransferase [Candidatus Nanoarchaeia archaeon]
MKKVLFSKKIDKANLDLRDYLLDKFSKYVNLDNCELLEVGCGNGRFASLLGPKIKSYSGIEPDKEYLRIAKETTPRNVNAKYYHGKAEDISITNKKFDVILYAFSWHFIKDFDKAINEAKRLLKKEGIIVIYEPSKDTNNWASSKLRKGSKDFDEKLHKKKLLDLEGGRRAISKLEGLFVAEEEVDNEEKPNLWVLKASKEVS